MNNTVTTSEIKRRGMAAIEDGLSRGPLHILKRNRPAAVVLSEAEYQRLLQGGVATPAGLSAHRCLRINAMNIEQSNGVWSIVRKLRLPST